jgi:1-acyl-sn-glycerol-3-phosphate acyltransferase
MLVRQSKPGGWRGWIYSTAVHFAVAMARTLLFWRLEGTQNIPRTGPLLVVANHPSYLDPPSLVALMIYYAGRDVSIMAWDKLFRVPLVGFFAATYKAYPVNRENPGRGPYATLLKILHDGGAAGVFPEGSRSEGPLMGGWKPGALRAAFATKATILPITFVTVGEFWPKTRWRPRIFRQHRIVVHKPLTHEEYKAPDGVRDKDYQEQAAGRIREIINGPILKRQQDWEQHMREKLRQGETLRDKPDAIELRKQRHADARRKLRQTA